MKMNHSISIALTLLSFQGCASSPRVLSIRSDPADAEVCIKGRSQSEYFKQAKNCIGTTPLEVDAVTVTDEHGKKRVVHFNELDPETDQFYLVVSRSGYAPQSMGVPGWSHFVSLHQEQPKAEAAPAPAPLAVKTNGSARISSDPVGALVYVNDFLKGNTPYVLEGDGGQTIRLKIEQAGYEPLERSITMESGKMMEINLSLESTSEEIADDEDEDSRTLASEQSVK